MSISVYATNFTVSSLPVFTSSLSASTSSFEVRAKTPAEVFGERVLRPVVDAAYSFTTRSVQVLKSNFLSFDSALTKMMQLFPVAQASEVANNKATNPTGQTSYDCPSLQALANAHAKVTQHQIDTSQRALVIQQSQEPFKTPDEAIAYLEARMGAIEIPHTHCLAEKSIRLIIKRKTPNSLQKSDLKHAYNELLSLLSQDALKFCEPLIMELLNEFSTNLQQYSLSALDLLPNVLFSLLQHSGKDQTFADIDLLVTKINLLSREMVAKYQKTNQEKTLHQWIDILLESAERNTDNSDTILASFKTAVKIMQSSSQEKLQREQKKKLRKMAIQYQTRALSPQQLAVVAEVMQATGSKIRIVNYINSYLECLPDDIQNINESLSDIAKTFYQNKKVQVLTGASLLVPLVLMPDRVKKALVILSIGLAIHHFMF